jgi:aryl-alcohol dehydrogenase-like predicted oxidoreductase
MGLGSGGVSLLGQSNRQPREHSHRLVRAALELGINHFDTAPRYQESESLLGEALQGTRRDVYTLTTKFPPEGAAEGDPSELAQRESAAAPDGLCGRPVPALRGARDVR